MTKAGEIAMGEAKTTSLLKKQAKQSGEGLRWGKKQLEQF